MTNVAIVVAAGRGSRAGGGLPKQVRSDALSSNMSGSLLRMICHAAGSWYCFQTMLSGGVEQQQALLNHVS